MGGSLRSATLLEGLNAAGEAARLTFHLEGGTHSLRSSEIATRAAARAGGLRAAGVSPGDRVGVLGPNRPEWAISAFSVWAAGAVLVPIPFPIRIRDRSVFGDQVAALVRAAGSRLVLADPDLLDAVPAGAGLDWNDVPERGHGGVQAPPDPSAPAVVQFTSGGTASPKGAVLSHGAVVASIGAMGRAYGFTPEDVFLGWLPFFHDNGLFGYLVRPLLMSSSGHVLPTERFARVPREWLRLATEVGATFTSGPPSGWSAALRASLAEPEGIDLSTLRLGVLAAETVEPDLVGRLAERGPALGLRAESLAVAYGLAEATLTVTITPPGSGIRIDEVDLDALGAGVGSPAVPGSRSRRVVSCGRPLPGLELRIAGEEPPGDRRVGEIQVRGPTVMDGYLGRSAPAAFADGWLRTGDLGYLADGELFFVGRIKDVVVVLGRTYPAEDLEWAAARVAGVRAGRCVAFSGGDGHVVVVVEPEPSADPGALAASVRNAVVDATGITSTRALVVPRGTIPKTTSGKLRRHALREAFEAGGLPDAVAPVRPRTEGPDRPTGTAGAPPGPP